jgi:hypothetical protein
MEILNARFEASSFEGNETYETGRTFDYAKMQRHAPSSKKKIPLNFRSEHLPLFHDLHNLHVSATASGDKKE